MNNADLIARHQAAITLNYGKLPAALVRGQGSRVWDADGKEYLDLFAGFGGTILGHAHPALIAAVTEQASKLWTTGNQFYTEPQIRLAESLKKMAFDGRAFFCHSGAEANEGAIKLARLAGGEGRYKIISMYKGFHGRTLGALSATATPEYQKGFLPMVAGFTYVPYNDIAALEAAIDPQTCGIILEPIQGEGGLNLPSPVYFKAVRELCDKNKLTLIIDEVWTGCARTGIPFAYQHEKIVPDIMTLGKALGGGLPAACMFAKPELAAMLKPGMHGCTLGGNPICAAAAATVLQTIEKENLSARAAQLGEIAVSRIRNFKNGKVKDVRGRGLMLGVELTIPDGAPIVTTALAKGLIINATQKNVLRLAPALTIEEKELVQGLELLDEVLNAA